MNAVTSLTQVQSRAPYRGRGLGPGILFLLQKGIDADGRCCSHSILEQALDRYKRGQRGRGVEDEESMPDCSSETVDKLDRLDRHPKQSDQQSQ